MNEQAMHTVDAGGPDPREDIALQHRDVFLEAGGEHCGCIPCLNDHPSRAALLAGLLGQHLQGWTQAAT